MKPYFSIIVPVYNVAPYLEACLNSVLAQQYTDWECICVDDGSVDGSGALVDSFVRFNKRFFAVHTPNEGVSVARNQALVRAKGTVYSFLDGDDALLPQWLCVAKELLEETSAPALSLWLQRWDGTHIEMPAKIEKIERFYGKRAVLSSLWERLAGYICMWFLRADVNKDGRFPKGIRFAEDLVYQLGIAIEWNSYVKCRYRGYLYRNRPGSAVLVSQTEEEQRNLLEEMLHIWEITLDRIPEVAIWLDVRQAASRYFAYGLVGYLVSYKGNAWGSHFYQAVRGLGLLEERWMPFPMRCFFVWFRCFRTACVLRWMFRISHFIAGVMKK